MIKVSLLFLLVESSLTNLTDTGGFNRGYERLRAQNFEKRPKGDLKEGFYLGKDLPTSDPLVLAKRFGQGPNKYPTEVKDPKAFQSVMDEYHVAMTSLAVNILRVLSWTLGLEDGFFDTYCENPVAALRLLHYPPQDPATTDTERGMITSIVHERHMKTSDRSNDTRNRSTHRLRRCDHPPPRRNRRTPSME